MIQNAAVKPAKLTSDAVAQGTALAACNVQVRDSERPLSAQPSPRLKLVQSYYDKLAAAPTK